MEKIDKKPVTIHKEPPVYRVECNGTVVGKFTQDDGDWNGMRALNMRGGGKLIVMVEGSPLMTAFLEITDEPVKAVVVGATDGIAETINTARAQATPNPESTK